MVQKIRFIISVRKGNVITAGETVRESGEIYTVYGEKKRKDTENVPDAGKHGKTGEFHGYKYRVDREGGSGSISYVDRIS